MKDKLRMLAVGTFSSLGILCITSGLAIPKYMKIENSKISKVTKLAVTQNQVKNIKSNEIKLKDIKLEVGNVLSSDTREYLTNANDIEESIIKRLKLDTSQVNTNQTGNYIYTITYNKKIYNGTISIIQKPLPNVDNITLNTLSFEINQTLPTDITTYIKEQLPSEVINAMRLDLSNVVTTKPGSYLYSIIYNGKLYTNTITIYEPKYGNNSETNVKVNKNS